MKSCPTGRKRGGFVYSQPSPTVFDGPPLPESEGSFRAVDSATSPSASRRMTGLGGILWRWKVFGLEKPTKRESGVTGVFFMMLGTLFFDWIICWVLNKSGSYRAFCRYKLEWTSFFIHSDFSPLYHSATSLTGHSARRACPELQNPHFKKQRKTLSPLGRSWSAGRMRGDLTWVCTHLSLSTGETSPGGRG